LVVAVDVNYLEMKFGGGEEINAGGEDSQILTAASCRVKLSIELIIASLFNLNLEKHESKLAFLLTPTRKRGQLYV
jgi:hypothetical protein